MTTPKNHPPISVPDLSAERLQALRELLPEAFSEGKIDFDRLRAALGDLVDYSPERYSFSWAGKRDAIRLLQTPTRATLAPAPGESLDFDSTRNIFIEGDNLEALKLLYKPYFGRVKMIYIDPPYNTGNDFIYPDDCNLTHIFAALAKICFQPAKLLIGIARQISLASLFGGWISCNKIHKREFLPRLRG